MQVVQFIRSMILLVTVGTTRFDSLINAVLKDDFINGAKQLGFTRVTIQYGKSQISQSNDNYDGRSGMVTCVPFIDVLEMGGVMDECTVVIGHAGSGTALDVLRGPITSLYPPRTAHSLQKTNGRRPALLLVPNTDLMDNHQMEIAEELSKMGSVTISRPDSAELLDALKNVMQSRINYAATPLLPHPQRQQLNHTINSLVSQ